MDVKKIVTVLQDLQDELSHEHSCGLEYEEIGNREEHDVLKTGVVPAMDSENEDLPCPACEALLDSKNLIVELQKEAA